MNPMADLISSHIPVNMDVLAHLGHVNLIFEIGGGDFSTELFLQRASRVITLEQGQNISKKVNRYWLKHLKAKYSSFSNWTLVDLPGKTRWKKYGFPTTVDYAFVDGNGDCRVEIVEHMMKLNYSVIGAHDTEQPSYGWAKIKELDYQVIQYRMDSNEVYTSIWTLNANLATYLLQKPGYFVGNIDGPKYK